MGTQPVCFESQLILYFMNQIYLPCRCFVFFVVCQLLGPNSTKSTTPHTDSPSVRRSKRINPMKITLMTQFFRRIKKETLNFYVGWLATQFRPQRLCYEIFIPKLLCSQIQKSTRPKCLGQFPVRIVLLVTLISPTGIFSIDCRLSMTVNDCTMVAFPYKSF